MTRPFRDIDGVNGAGVGVLESHNAHGRLGLHAIKSQAINMGDVAITLVRAASTVATEVQLLANLLIVDAQSSGAGENLILPPEALCKGLTLKIHNIGGENVVIQSDTPTTIVTLETGLAAILDCDGVTWRAMTGLAGDIQSANIADGAVTSAKLETGLLQFQDTQLTAAQVNALLAANIEVVSSPGAGLAVFPVAAFIFLDHGGTDFVQVNVTDQLALKYSASNEITEFGTQAQCEALLEAGADASLYVTGFLTANPEGFVPEANKAIDLDNNGAAEYTTGDGTLSIRVWYYTMPMAAFS